MDPAASAIRRVSETPLKQSLQGTCPVAEVTTLKAGSLPACPSPVGCRHDGSAELTQLRDGPPDGGTDERAGDDVAGEMYPRVDPRAGHRCGQQYQGRPGPRQAVAYRTGERESGRRVTGRKRGRRRHGHLPSRRNLRTQPVWALPRVQGFGAYVDGRRGDAHCQQPADRSSPSCSSAGNRETRCNGDPDAREVRSLRQPPSGLVQQRRRSGRDRGIEGPISSAEAATSGGETHYRMLAMGRLALGPSAPADGAGHG